MDFLIFQLYRWLALPTALTLLHLLQGFLPAKIQEMIKDRENLNLQLLPARPLWIHASSGEIEYAKSVIRKLKAEFPQTPILVTYFSPSAKKLIQKFPGIDLAMALPWDSMKAVKKFLDFYQPRLFLIARTDVWPEIAHEARLRKIPSLLFAATMTRESSRRGFFAGSLSRTALGSLDQIFAVSSDDQQVFHELGVPNVEVAGDTRYDQVLYRLQNPNPVRTELRPPFSATKSGKIFVAGSTWPQDEEVLLPALTSWITLGNRVILAPHEISEARLSELEKKLAGLNFKFDRYSKAVTWNSDLLLVDQVGCLQELYTWGDVAFVGGSFKDKIHSVMEPLCVGLPVLVGPKHTNNREALQFQHVILEPGFFAVNVMQNSRDFQESLSRCLKISTPSPKILQKIQDLSGGSTKIADWVRPLMSRSSQKGPLYKSLTL